MTTTSNVQTFIATLKAPPVNMRTDVTRWADRVTFQHFWQDVLNVQLLHVNATEADLVLYVFVPALRKWVYRSRRVDAQAILLDSGYRNAVFQEEVPPLYAARWCWSDKTQEVYPFGAPDNLDFHAMDWDECMAHTPPKSFKIKP